MKIEVEGVSYFNLIPENDSDKAILEYNLNNKLFIDKRFFQDEKYYLIQGEPITNQSVG